MYSLEELKMIGKNCSMEGFGILVPVLPWVKYQRKISDGMESASRVFSAVPFRKQTLRKANRWLRAIRRGK